jgi:hypothetical protein
MSLIHRRATDLYTTRAVSGRANRTRTNSSDRAAGVSCSRLSSSAYPNCWGAVNQRLKSLSSGKSAATFCGSPRWVTASGDPVGAG